MLVLDPIRYPSWDRRCSSTGRRAGGIRDRRAGVQQPLRRGRTRGPNGHHAPGLTSTATGLPIASSFAATRRGKPRGPPGWPAGGHHFSRGGRRWPAGGFSTPNRVLVHGPDVARGVPRLALTAGLPMAAEIGGHVEQLGGRRSCNRSGEAHAQVEQSIRWAKLGMC